MHRQENHEAGNTAKLQYCFKRLKCENGKWGWTDGKVVPQVQILENWPPVHESMQPIEISIVDKEADDEAGRQVIQRIGAKFPIYASKACFIHFEQPCRHR